MDLPNLVKFPLLGCGPDFAEKPDYLATIDCDPSYERYNMARIYSIANHVMSACGEVEVM